MYLHVAVQVRSGVNAPETTMLVIVDNVFSLSIMKKLFMAEPKNMTDKKMVNILFLLICMYNSMLVSFSVSTKLSGWRYQHWRQSDSSKPRGLQHQPPEYSILD